MAGRPEADPGLESPCASPVRPLAEHVSWCLRSSYHEGFKMTRYPCVTLEGTGATLSDRCAPIPLGAGHITSSVTFSSLCLRTSKLPAPALENKPDSGTTQTWVGPWSCHSPVV